MKYVRFEVGFTEQYSDDNTETVSIFCQLNGSNVKNKNTSN
jgi:hypothetical protein